MDKVYEVLGTNLEIKSNENIIERSYQTWLKSVSKARTVVVQFNILMIRQEFYEIAES